MKLIMEGLVAINGASMIKTDSQARHTKAHIVAQKLSLSQVLEVAGLLGSLNEHMTTKFIDLVLGR